MNDSKKSADTLDVLFVIEKIRNLFNYYKYKSKTILIFVAIGLLIGLGYSFIQPKKYQAKVTFVVEEGKSSMSSLASLAGQFGFDLGGSSVGGVLSGENILLFLKSENLCRETLLSVYDSTQQKTLADVYARSTGQFERWKDNSKIGEINFYNYRDKLLPRVYDSLLQKMVTRIIKSDLQVIRPDKRASFVQVKTGMRDEILSKLFCERLLDLGTNKYVSSKIKVKASNVAMLQRRADSLSAILNEKTYQVASLQQSLIDVNPALRATPIKTEINTREKSMNAALYAEVVKNLELSKTLLSQETPVIQVVDRSTFPLVVERVGKISSTLLGGFIALVLALVYFLFKKWYLSLRTNLS